MPSLAALRHAPWSSSKVKTALRCAQEFHFKYVEGISEPEVSPEQRIGKAVHAALELVLGRRGIDEALELGRALLLLDEERLRYDAFGPAVRAFVQRIETFRARKQPRAELIEHKLAFDALLHPTGFLDGNAFYRGILDAGFEYGDGELALIDHKTGLRRPAADFTEQLEGYASLAVTGHAGVRRVWLGVHFVAESAMEWSAPVAADLVRAEITPRLVETIELAGRAASAGAQPQPGPYCAWCAYRRLCPAMRYLPSEPTEAAGQEAAALAAAAGVAAARAVEALAAPAVEIPPTPATIDPERVD